MSVEIVHQGTAVVATAIAGDPHTYMPAPTSSGEGAQQQQEQAGRCIDSFLDDFAEEPAVGMSPLPPEQPPEGTTDGGDGCGLQEQAQDPNAFAEAAVAAARRATGFTDAGGILSAAAAAELEPPPPPLLPEQQQQAACMDSVLQPTPQTPVAGALVLDSKAAAAPAGWLAPVVAGYGCGAAAAQHVAASMVAAEHEQESAGTQQQYAALPTGMTAVQVSEAVQMVPGMYNPLMAQQQAFDALVMAPLLSAYRVQGSVAVMGVPADGGVGITYTFGTGAAARPQSQQSSAGRGWGRAGRPASQLDGGAAMEVAAELQHVHREVGKDQQQYAGWMEQAAAAAAARNAVEAYVLPMVGPVCDVPTWVGGQLPEQAIEEAPPWPASPPRPPPEQPLEDTPPEPAVLPPLQASTKFRVRVPSSNRLGVGAGMQHGRRGVSESHPGSGRYRIQIKLAQECEPVHASAYPSEVLAAAAYDHACIWHVLRQQRLEQQGTEAAALSPQQVQAAIQGLQGELNHPLDKYAGDAALLAKLSGSSRQQLQEHLQPFQLQQWVAWAVPAGGPAAPLRRDNTTRFVGVARITNSQKLAAAITVEGGREHLGSFDTATQAAVVRDIGIIWKQLRGLSGDSPLNLPHLNLDKDTELVEQLRGADSTEALREVLASWVPANLQDVVSCLPGSGAGGGQRAIVATLADIVLDAAGSPKAPNGLGLPHGMGSGQQQQHGPPIIHAAQPFAAGPAAALACNGPADDGDSSGGSQQGSQAGEEDSAGSGSGQGGSDEGGDESASGESDDEAAVQQCSHCGDDQSRSYHLHPISGKLLCINCAAYLKRTGHDRPAKVIEAYMAARADGGDRHGRGRGRGRPSAGRGTSRLAAAGQPTEAAVVAVEDTELSSDEDAAAADDLSEEWSQPSEEEDSSYSEEKPHHASMQRHRRQPLPAAAPARMVMVPPLRKSAAGVAAAVAAAAADTSDSEEGSEEEQEQEGECVSELRCGSEQEERGEASQERDVAAGAASDDGLPWEWQDEEHTRMLKIITKDESDSQDFIFPVSVWNDLFGGVKRKVLLRHASSGEEWIIFLSDTTLHLPGVFEKFDLHTDDRVLLRVAAFTVPDAANANTEPVSSPRGGGGGRAGWGRGRGRGRVGQQGLVPEELPTVELTRLMSVSVAAMTAGNSNQRECEECHVTTTVKWRKHPDRQGQGHSLCNVCGKRAWEDLRARQQQQRQQQQEEEEQSEDEPSLQQEQQEEEEQSEDEPPLQQQQPEVIELPAPASASGKQCSHCSSQQPGPPGTKYSWRRHPTSKALLCARCCRFADRHGGELPALPEEEQHQQYPQPDDSEEQEHKQSVPQQPEQLLQRQCLQCGSTRKGTVRYTSWHRHPVTGEEWLCHPCFYQFCASVKRQRRQQQQEESEAEEAEEEKEQVQHLEEESQEEQRQPPQRRCLHCDSISKGSASYATWHRHPATGKEWLCQPCFNQARAAVKRWQQRCQQQQEEAEKEQQEEQEKETSEEEPPEPPQRQCLQCRSTRKGTVRYATWHRHPTTGEEWLCTPCFNQARAAVKRQHADKHVGELPALPKGEQDEEQQHREEAASGHQHKRQQQGPQLQMAGAPAAVATADEAKPVSTRRRKQQQVTAAAPVPVAIDAPAEPADEAGPAARGGERLRCSHCGVYQPGPTPTYPWRRHHTTNVRLCKDCWLYERKFHGFLPELPLRQRQQQSAAPEPQSPAPPGRLRRQPVQLDPMQDLASPGQHRGRRSNQLQQQPVSQAAAACQGKRRGRGNGEEQEDAAVDAGQIQQAEPLLSLPRRRVLRHQQQQQEQQQGVGVEDAAAGPAGGRKRTRWQQQPEQEAAEQEEPRPGVGSHKHAQRQLVEVVEQGQRQEEPRPGVGSRKHAQRQLVEAVEQRQGYEEAVQPGGMHRRGHRQCDSSLDAWPAAARRKRSRCQQDEEAEEQEAGSEQQQDIAAEPGTKRRRGQQKEVLEAAAAGAPAARPKTPGIAKGRGGGHCRWVNDDLTALEAEVNELCIRTETLVLPAAMAAKLTGLAGSGRLHLCDAHSGSAIRKWTAELSAGKIEAEKLFANLDVREGDRLLLQRQEPPPPRAKLPVLLAARLARGGPADKAMQDALAAVAAAVAAAAATLQGQAQEEGVAEEKGAAAAVPAADGGQAQQQRQVQQPGMAEAAAQEQQQEQQALAVAALAQHAAAAAGSRGQLPSTSMASSAGAQQQQQQQQQRQGPPVALAMFKRAAEQPAMSSAPRCDDGTEQEAPQAAAGNGGAVAPAAELPLAEWDQPLRLLPGGKQAALTALPRGPPALPRGLEAPALLLARLPGEQEDVAQARPPCVALPPPPAAAGADMAAPAPASTAPPPGGNVEPSQVLGDLVSALSYDTAAQAAGLTADMVFKHHMQWESLRQEQKHDRAKILHIMLKGKLYDNLVKFLEISLGQPGNH